jgi:hypothetical protein
MVGLRASTSPKGVGYSMQLARGQKEGQDKKRDRSWDRSDKRGSERVKMELGCRTQEV